jgi:hypothetical protein
VLIEQPAYLIMDFLLVLHAREQDADAIGIILEVRGFIVDDKEDLSVLPKGMLFAFPPHVAVPLFSCRCGIGTVIAEDAQRFSSRSGSSVVGIKDIDCGRFRHGRILTV